MNNRRLIVLLFILLSCLFMNQLLRADDPVYGIVSFIKHYPEFKRGYDPWADFSGTVQENVDAYTGKLALTYQLPGIPFSETAAFSPTLMYNSNIWSISTPSWQIHIEGGELKNPLDLGTKDQTPIEPPERPEVLKSKIANYYDNDAWLRFSLIGQPHNMPGWSLPIGGVYTERTEVSTPIGLGGNQECANPIPTVMTKKYFIAPDGSSHVLVDLATNCRPVYGLAADDEWCNYLCNINGNQSYYCLLDTVQPGERNIWRATDGSGYYYIQSLNRVYGPDGTRYDLVASGDYAGMIQKITDTDGNWIDIILEDTIPSDPTSGSKIVTYTSNTGAWMEIEFIKKYLPNYDPNGNPVFIKTCLLHEIRYPSVDSTQVLTYCFGYEPLISYLQQGFTLPGGERLYTEFNDNLNILDDDVLTFGDIFHNPVANCGMTSNPDYTDEVFCCDEPPDGSTFNQANQQIWVLTSIALPDGRSFHFHYNHAGKISHVIYPDGGYRRYDYGNTWGRNFNDNIGAEECTIIWDGKIGAESPLGGVSRVLQRESPVQAEVLERLYAYSGFHAVTERYNPDSEPLHETISWFADGSIQIQRFFYVVKDDDFATHAVITDYGLPYWQTGKKVKTTAYQKHQWSETIRTDPAFKYDFLRIMDDTGTANVSRNVTEYKTLREFITEEVDEETEEVTQFLPLREEETHYQNADDAWVWTMPGNIFCSDCLGTEQYLDYQTFYNYIIPIPEDQKRPEWNTVVKKKIIREFENGAVALVKKTEYEYGDVQSEFLVDPDTWETTPGNWYEPQYLLIKESEFDWHDDEQYEPDWIAKRITVHDYHNFWLQDYVEEEEDENVGVLPARALGLSLATRIIDPEGNLNQNNWKLKAATWNQYPALSSSNTNGIRFHPEWVYQLKVKDYPDFIPQTDAYPEDDSSWTRAQNSYSVITVNGSNLVRLVATQAYDLTTLQNTVMFNYDSDGLLQSARIFDSGGIERQYMLTEYHPLTGLLLRRTDQNGDRNMSYYIEESKDDYLLLKYDIYNRPSEVILKHKNGSSAEQLTLTTYEYPLTTPYTVKRYDYIDNDIRTTTVENDGLGRAAVTRASLNSGTESYSEKQFDVLGRVQFEPYPTEVPVGAKRLKSDPLGITHIYDDLGREVETRKPGLGGTKTTTSSFIEYGVDTNTLCTTEKIIDEVGRYRLLYKDGLGRLVRVDEPDPELMGGILDTYYSYDILDNLTQVATFHPDQTPEQTRTFTYDALGRLLTATLPEYNNATMTYTYDDLGNLTGKFLGGNYTETLGYDDLGRLIARQATLEGIRVDYAYEYDVCTEPAPAGFTASPDYNFGRLVRDKVIYPDQTYIERFFAYDWRGLPAQKGERFGQTGGSDVEFLTEYRSYDAQGNLQTMIYPSGQRVDLSYGAHGLLSGLQWNAADVMGTIRYAPHGAPQEAHAYGFDGGEVAWYQEFNDRLWPSNIYTDDFSSPPIESASKRTLLGLTYSYENNGNITSIYRGWRERYDGTWENAHKMIFDYAYDSLNRLNWALYRDDKEYPPAFRGEYTYVMDRYGNISARNRVEPSYGTDPAPPDAVYLGIHVATNRLNGGQQQYNYVLDYDTLGNLRRIGTTGQWMDLQYMNQGHVYRAVDGTSGDEWRYYYDADGKRRIKAMGASGIFDNVSYYFYEGEDLICQQDNGNALQDSAAYDTKFLLVDHLGTTRAEMQFIEDQGLKVPTIVKAYDFMPYGEELAPDVSPLEQIKFTEKSRDDETDLDYFNERFLSFQLQRFLSVDKLMVTFPKLIDPQQLNLYSYVRNNPIIYIDPTGMTIDIGFLNEDELKVWKQIVELANAVDSDTGEYLHPELHDQLTMLENDHRFFKIEFANLGKGLGGKFEITQFDGEDDFIEATITLNSKHKHLVESVADPNFVQNFVKHQGLNKKAEKYAEVFGHEAAHGTFAIFFPREAVLFQKILPSVKKVRRDAAQGMPIPPDFFETLARYTEIRNRSETYAHQVEKIINGELQASKIQKKR